MIVNGEALGVIATQGEVDDRFDRHDLEILEVIAGQAAAAIKHARLLEAARRAYQDLSEAQARLLEVERVRAITEAVGAMNHEINNPLAAIVGNAQLLMRRNGDSGQTEITSKVESILDGARRIQEVTTKMSTLIQATSMPYPGEAPILDIRRSVAEGDTCALFPVPPAFRKSA
jgi:signal transduction histidine kinase